MAESNKPKHGDPIIEKVKGSLGGEKLQASFQFQRFLDELGALFDVATDTEDNQETHLNASEIGQLRARNILLSSLVRDNMSLITDLDSMISKIRSESRILERRVDDLEQLINVDQG